MKKILSALFAGLILATGAQALAAGCENRACTLPEKQDQAYCYGKNDAYYCGNTAQTARSDERRGGCGCWGER